MKSIRSVYKVGHGPSSSHTVGPYNAAEYFKNRHKDADGFKVVLYGSLALTGAGHGTAKAINAVLPGAEILYDIKTPESELPHPNTMDFIAIKDGRELDRTRVLSVGGGAISIEGDHNEELDDVYTHNSYSEIMSFCKTNQLSLPEYIYAHEKIDIRKLLKNRWHSMEACVEKGLCEEGELPGGLGVMRKAKTLFNTVSYNESSDVTMDRLISAFAYAVSEENAAGSTMVTAPTCGSCGVIPAIFYYMRHYKGFSEDEIVDALAVSAMIGNIIRTNASISGAECGCQAEIGSACSMAAAGLAHLYGMNLDQIEYAAEVAMEHHLGLTCDPVMGLVQIPCIERNAVAAMRAINAVNLARFLYTTRRVSFDTVVETMYRTGLDMSEKYRETANGGLAQMYKK